MRVDLVGVVGVRSDSGAEAVAGQELGGRRARVALAALALARAPVPADRLASIIWGDDLPATWPVAVRGVVGGLRSAGARIGAGQQGLVVTVPAGYCLAPGVSIDVDLAADAVRAASKLSAQGRHRAALELSEPVAAMTGRSLLAGEDGDWLEPHRRAVDAVALRALRIVVAAAGALGEHDTAVNAGRRAVNADPLDERAHRALIAALDGLGDRAGAVQAFDQCRRVLADQLGIDPSPETVDTYLTALRDQQPTGGVARLPVVTSSYQGREDEIRRLDEAINRPGLVTVTGSGGVGKSRLALRVAATRSDFAGGRLWVPLTPVGQDALVAASVAFGLGVPASSEDPTPALVRHLAPLGRVLLILDGCEFVVDGVASLVAELVAACPQLTLLVTSRMPLAIDGESVLTVAPMSSPAEAAGVAALQQNVQVQLLLDRVRAGGGELNLDEQVAPHIAALLRRCGGLPLAVELVAAQLAAMPVGDLLDHMGTVALDGDDWLRSVARSSYLLLDPDEATVFRRLAVLDGEAGLPLVRQVTSGGPIEEVRVVRILRELTVRGLLTVDRAKPRWRYHQDDDVHRFARELLEEAGEERSTFARLARAIQALLPDDARASPAPFTEAISDVLGSVRSLFAAALDERADVERSLELAFRLHRYFAATNVAEGRFWLARLVAAEPASPWTKYATYALGYLSYWAGDTEAAMGQLSSAVGLFAGVEDAYAARASIFLAGLYDDVDRGADAVEAVRGAIAAAAPFDVDLQVAAAMGLGSVLAERGDPMAARYAQDAVAMCRQGGSPAYLALLLPTAAMVCWQVGALEDCRAYVAEAMPMHASERRIARVVLLSVAAGLALTDGDLGAATDFGLRADLEGTELGVEREVPLIRAVRARTALAAGDIAGAAERTIAALDAAGALTFTFPFAVCFETAALVGAAFGADRTDLATLLASADTIRRRGDRPALPSMSEALVDLSSVVGAGEPVDVTAAAALARAVLAST